MEQVGQLHPEGHVQLGEHRAELRAVGIGQHVELGDGRLAGVADPDEPGHPHLARAGS